MHGKLGLGLLAVTLVVVGCTQNYYWYRSGTDRNTFEMDKAKCQMYAQNYTSNRSNPYNTSTIEVSSSGYYDPDIGYYSGEATVNQYDPLKPFLDAVAEDDAYKLCLQSKGYRKSKVPKSYDSYSSGEVPHETDPNKKMPCESMGSCPPNYVCAAGWCSEVSMPSKTDTAFESWKYSAENPSAAMYERNRRPVTDRKSQPPISCQNDNYCPDNWSCKSGFCEKD